MHGWALGDCGQHTPEKAFGGVEHVGFAIRDGSVSLQLT